LCSVYMVGGGNVDLEDDAFLGGERRCTPKWCCKMDRSRQWRMATR